MADTDLTVTDNPDASRFELHVEGHLAELVYRRRGDRLILVHTEVPEELGGRGLGGVLVRAAVDRAAAEGLTVAPWCPFARSWLEKHPDEAARIAVDWSPPPEG
jgi:predicted GNAT family acetyltransferase